MAVDQDQAECHIRRCAMDVLVGVVAAAFIFGVIVLAIWVRRLDRDLPELPVNDQVTDDERRARQLGMALNGPLSSFGR
jgi:hypothetical protein